MILKADSTGNTSAVSALSMAMTPGAEIRIPAGRYKIDSTIIKDLSRRSLRMIGEGHVTLVCSQGAYLSITKVESLSIERIGLENGHLHIPEADGVTIHELQANGGQYGVLAPGADGFSAFSCDFRNLSRSGIRLAKSATRACRNVVIDGVVGEEIGYAAMPGHALVMVGSDGGAANAHQGITIRNVNGEDIRHIGIGVDGNIEHLTVEHCSITCVGATGEALAIGGPVSHGRINDLQLSRPRGTGASCFVAYDGGVDLVIRRLRTFGGGNSVFFHWATTACNWQTVSVADCDFVDGRIPILLLANRGIVSSSPARNVVIGTNRVTNPGFPYSVERSSVPPADRPGISIMPQIIDGVRAMYHRTGWGTQVTHD